MQKKKAISLIVLVITIIVTIILSGAILITLSNAGIIKQSENAVKEYDLDEIQTLVGLKWSEAYMEIEGKKTVEKLEPIVMAKLKEEGVDLKKYKITVRIDGAEVVDLEMRKKWENVEFIEETAKTIKQQSMMAGTTNLEQLKESVKRQLVVKGAPQEIIDNTYFIITMEDIIVSLQIQPFKIEQTENAISKFYNVNGEIVLIIEGDGTCPHHLGNSTINHLIIKEGIVEIPSYYFHSWKNLKSIVLPDSLINLGYQSFHSCVNLESIIFGNSLTNVQSQTFYAADNLLEVVIPVNLKTIERQYIDQNNEHMIVYYQGTQEQWSKMTISRNEFINPRYNCIIINLSN